MYLFVQFTITQLYSIKISTVTIEALLTNIKNMKAFEYFNAFV